jgi:hypothetical protein
MTQRQRDVAALLGVMPQLLKPVLRGIGLWLVVAGILAFVFIKL